MTSRVADGGTCFISTVYARARERPNREICHHLPPGPLASSHPGATLAPVESVARCNTLAALARVFVGPAAADLVNLLRKAEADAARLRECDAHCRRCRLCPCAGRSQPSPPRFPCRSRRSPRDDPAPAPRATPTVVADRPGVTTTLALYDLAGALGCIELGPAECVALASDLLLATRTRYGRPISQQEESK
jgi:hypothetical protein